MNIHIYVYIYIYIYIYIHIVVWGGADKSALRSPQHISYRGLCSGGWKFPTWGGNFQHGYTYMVWLGGTNSFVFPQAKPCIKAF